MVTELTEDEKKALKPIYLETYHKLVREGNAPTYAAFMSEREVLIAFNKIKDSREA